MRDSALNASGRWWGFNADSVLPKLFSGGKDLAKPRLIFLHFVRAEEGSGEESARALGFFGDRLTDFSKTIFYRCKFHF